MVLSGEITARIREVLEQHPEGISITDLVKSVDINRNTAGRYLENLLLSGQVEMRRFGMAKLYTLTKRLPVSSVLSLSSDLVIQLNAGQQVFYANDPLLRFLGVPAEDLFGKNIEFTRFPAVFEDVSDELLDRFGGGLRGEAWQGELTRPVQGRSFFCRVTPTVSNEGKKGLSIILEDITDRKRDEELIRQSEARLRSIFKVSPVGIGVMSDRIFREVNDRFCEMTGYSRDDLEGKSARMLYATDEIFNDVGTAYMNQIRRIGSSTLETQWVRKNGTVVDILLNSTPLDPANITGGITFTALDITARNRALQASRESEERLQLALFGSETGMWEIDIPSMRGSFDERAAAILGYRKTKGRSHRNDWDALTHPDDLPLIHSRLADYLEGRTPLFESEHRMRHASDRWIWVMGRGKITSRSRDGSSKRVSGTIQDITARKIADQSLRESEERYRYLVEQSLQGLTIIQNGRPVFANDAMLKIIGYSREEYLAFSAEEMMAAVHPDDRIWIGKVMADRLAERNIPAENEFRILRKNGQVVWVITHGALLPYDGAPAIQVTYFDITTRKLAEQAQRESEETARALLNAPTDTIILLDSRGVILDLNETAVQRLGRRREDLVGRVSDTVIPPALAEQRRKKISKVLETGKPVRFFDENRGSWFDNVVYPVLDNQGDVARLAIIARDITDQKRMEASLRESEEKYRSLVEKSLQGLTIIQNGRPIFANTAMLEIGNYSYDEYLALSPEELMATVHTEDRDRIRHVMAARLAGKIIPAENEFRILRRDGQIRWVLSRGMLITYNGASAIQVAYFDITIRKLAEDALRESEDRYRKLVEISPNAVLLHRDRRIIYANQALADILGAERADDLLGTDVADLIHPAYREVVRANISNDLLGRPTPFMELQMIRRDGTLITVEGQGVGTSIDGKPAVLVAIRSVSGPRNPEQVTQTGEDTSGD